MAWLALLLLGFGFTDLAHTLVYSRTCAGQTPGRRLALALAPGPVATVAVAMLAGLWSGADLLALLVIVAVLVFWAGSVRGEPGAGHPGTALALFGSAVLLAVLCAPLADHAGGPLAAWLHHAHLSILRGVSADRFLLVAAGVLVQLSTGNVLVRLALMLTGTVNPARLEPGDPPDQLKGGRMLGPMERLLILGLGLAGQLTAAGIVVAAKGLLRFPELNSQREQDRVHRLSEYFLVGSFLSWLFALGTLAVIR